MTKIILASKSPRRSEILTKLKVEYEVVISEFDENQIKCDDPCELVEELALQKALAVGKLEQDAVIVGGDTVVAIDGEILGKAHSEEEARLILSKLFGRSHTVVTGVAVVNSLTGERAVGHATGKVVFRKVSEQELSKYIAEGKWRGFAGCYAIQGAAKDWVVEQTGSLSGIIGMPIILTAELLEEMGVEVQVDPGIVEDEIKGEKIGIDQ